MIKRVAAIATLGTIVATASASAQVAGSAVSGLDPVVVDSELRTAVSVQSGAILLESGYRYAPVPRLLDAGLRLGALSQKGSATTLTSAFDLRLGLLSHDHPMAYLPLNISLTGGVGVAFPDWTGQMVTFPVGLSIGGELPFYVPLKYVEVLELYAHPRFEYTKITEGDCLDAAQLCQSGWVFRSDIGFTGELRYNTRWFVIAGLGDTRFAGNGVSVGIRTAL